MSQTIIGNDLLNNSNNYWELVNEYKQIQQEITKLKGVIETYEILIKANNIHNWNELKKWLEEKMNVYEYQEASNFYVVLNKMQEIENRKVI